MEVNEYLKNLVQLIFAPARGWEDMAIEEREKFLDYRNRHLGETGGKQRGDLSMMRKTLGASDTRRICLGHVFSLPSVCARVPLS